MVGTPPPTPPRTKSVVAPTIRGIVDEVPWTGGVSYSMWTKTENKRPKTPFCFRGTKDAIKNYTKRTEGAKEKCKPDDADYSTQDFAEDASRHMERHVMDAIYYIPSPDSTPTTTVLHNIFTHHSLFTVEHI
jgi:hypothetical protein